MVGAGVVQKDEDWGRSDQLLQLVEGYLLQLFPFPFNILLGEVKQGTSMVGEVFDEPSVKVDEPNKGTEPLSCSVVQAILLCLKP